MPIRSDARYAQLRRLQKEIDKLAMLVFETKAQADKVKQAADAVGDAVFGELGPEETLLTALSSLVPSQDRRPRKTRTNGEEQRS